MKKTISLPATLAEEVERQAKGEGRTISAVIQDALRAAAKNRLSGEFASLQGYWSRQATARGVFSERELKRYLRD